VAQPTATHEAGTGEGATPVPAGQLKAEDIKGRMTLKEIAAGTGLPLADILAEAGLPADTRPTTQLKDLTSQIEGFEIETVREAVTRLLAAKP
jgi:hypothetical protein